MRGKDIGIIAPYVAQISLVTRLFTTDPKFLSRFESVLGKPRLQDLRDITISTVDGFEGQEKDVIIFSTVRNNAHGHIGFLADRRRLNVGLTRAKRGLFIVGSINTLRQSKVGGDSEAMAVMSGVMQGADVWKRYAEYLSEEKLVVSLRGEALKRLVHGNTPAIIRSGAGGFLEGSSRYLLSSGVRGWSHRDIAQAHLGTIVY